MNVRSFSLCLEKIKNLFKKLNSVNATSNSPGWNLTDYLEKKVEEELDGKYI